MLNIQLLQASKVLAGKTTQDIGTALGWSKSTLYRKMNGQTDWTAPEIQECTKLLNLKPESVQAIFFSPDLS